VEDLQYSDPTWLRLVAMGMVLIAPAIALHVTGAVLRWISDLPKGAAHLAGAVFLTIGAFLVTLKEPRPEGLGDGPRGSGRGLVLGLRILVLIELALWTMLALVSWKVMFAPVKWWVVLVLACQAAIAVMLGFYVSGLAARIPDDRLASHSSLCGWLVGLVCVSLMILRSLELTTPVHLGFFPCSFPMIGGMTALLLWAIITLMLMGANLRAAAIAGAQITARRIGRVADRGS
jgi:hypothetical protein